MPEQITRINIIGGGFCGTMVTYHLLASRCLPAQVAIHLYDRTGRHGRGVAYSTPFIEHLLNVPAIGMSALPDRGEDFVRWLGNEKSFEPDPTEFYPRLVYGEYVSSFLKQAQDMAREQSIPLILEVSDGPSFGEGQVTVIASGVSVPRWPGEIGGEYERAIPHPYGDAAMALYGDMDGIDHVAILGTGLSAVDAILSLHKAGYGGHITCIARKGLWPAPHGPKDKWWHWRRWIDSLRPHSNRIWCALPQGIRDFALRNVTWWNVVRHRMPPQCYAVVCDLTSQGRLRTRKGRILSVVAEGEGFVINTDRGAVRADAVINCLGFVDSAKRDLPRGEMVFVLGPPLFGKLIETTAVPELRVQAKECADRILKCLTSGTGQG